MVKGEVTLGSGYEREDAVLQVAQPIDLNRAKLYTNEVSALPAKKVLSS